MEIDGLGQGNGWTRAGRLGIAALGVCCISSRLRTESVSDFSGKTSIIKIMLFIGSYNSDDTELTVRVKLTCMLFYKHFLPPFIIRVQILKITVEDQLTFLKPLKDVEVVEGEQAELIVETNVHPRSVKWYKNGQQVNAVAGRIEIKDNTTKFRLIFKGAERSDAASYKVILFVVGAVTIPALACHLDIGMAAVASKCGGVHSLGSSLLTKKAMHLILSS